MTNKTLKALNIGAGGVVALLLAGGHVAEAAPPEINFGVTFVGGTPSYEGSNLASSTEFNLGGGPYVVNQIGAGDQSGLTDGDTVTFSNPVTYGSATSGPTSLELSWSGGAGTFTEEFTSFTADRSASNSIALEFSGTLSSHGGIAEPVEAIFNANQTGGRGHAVDWSLTDFASRAVPEPTSLALFGLGLAGLWVARRRRS